MARVKQNPQDNYNKPLAVRLRELIEKKGLSMLQLAKEIGVSRQAINSYTLGESVPDANNLTKIAEYFDVSTDYLLGLSPTKRLKVQGISALELGFSEEAISTILEMKKNGDIVYVNWLFEHELQGSFDVDDVHSYQGQLFCYIAKLLRFSEQSHSWPEIQIDNVNQIRLSNEHRSFDSYPVSDLVLRDINNEIRITLSDLEYLFIRKGELSTGKEHTVRNCDIEVF